MEILILITLIAFVFIGGYYFGKIFEKLSLPAVLGMTVLGVLGSLTLKSQIPISFWFIAPFVQSLALVVILLRAGLGISKETLQKIGKTAIVLGIVPCLFEGVSYLFLFKYLLGFSWVESGAIGFILAAVSPAVIVPSMLELKDKGYGKVKEIPTLVLAAASIDDVFAITLFSVFSGVYLGSELSLVLTLSSIPVKLILGGLTGLLSGYTLVQIYKRIENKLLIKVIGLVMVGYALLEFGKYSSLATLLGLMFLGYYLLEKLPSNALVFSKQLGKFWRIAQIALFVIIGLQVDISKLSDTGFIAIGIIFLGLVSRSIGVVLSVYNTGLNTKEKSFVVMSYTPKATVQAVMGGIPLALGMANGAEMLAISVLSIVITAPMGLILIRYFGPKFLEKDA
jgi:NhaP-type Na+/H+ or K+/H+ antiporter